jgi:hypothetical protein
MLLVLLCLWAVTRLRILEASLGRLDPTLSQLKKGI